MKKTIATILFSSIVFVGFAMQSFARADQQCDPSKPQTTPTSRFEINQMAGTAFDTITKLTWKICSEGQTYSDGQCTGNTTGFTWNKAMQAFNGKGNNWRLPNVDELNSIVEKQCLSPAVNLAVFPDISSKLDFWSGSSYIPNPSDAWFVDFALGGTSAGYEALNYAVRLVRGGQWIDHLKEGERQQAELAKKQQQEAEQSAARQKREAEQTAAKAEKNAYVACKDKASCDKMFSLTQIYINSTASQKIQVATDTIIETYNPTENGNIGLSAIKIPGKGSSSVIRLTVMCKIDERGIYNELCVLKRLGIYSGFRPFVNKMLSK